MYRRLNDQIIHIPSKFSVRAVDRIVHTFNVWRFPMFGLSPNQIFFFCARFNFDKIWIFHWSLVKVNAYIDIYVYHQIRHMYARLIFVKGKPKPLCNKPQNTYVSRQPWTFFGDVQHFRYDEFCVSRFCDFAYSWWWSAWNKNMEMTLL